MNTEKPKAKTSWTRIFSTPAFKAVLGAFILSRLILVLVTIPNMLTLPTPEEVQGSTLNPVLEETGFAATWYRWDAAWYVDIATTGYVYPATAESESTIHWFPVTPLLMNVVSRLTGLPIMWAGILVSNIAFVVALFWLYQLTYLELHERDTAQRAVLYAAIFPTALYFFVPASESLFLLFSVGAAYAARLGRWKLAALAGMITSATRIPGIFIGVFVALEWARAHGWEVKDLFNRQAWATVLDNIRKDWLNVAFICAIPSGLLVYFAYLGWKFGDWLAFFHDINEEVGLDFMTRFARSFNPESSYATPLGFVYLFIIALSLVPIARRLHVNYSIYSVLAVILPIVQGLFRATTRYVLVVFPMYIQLARWGKNRAFHLAYITIASTLLALNIVLFQRFFYIG
jgi:hypothetical protein